MKPLTTILIGGSIVGLGALAIYGKKQYTMVSNDLTYSYDKTSIKFTSAAINRVSMSMDLTVENSGEFSLEAKDLSVDIKTGDLILTKINKTGSFTIAPNVKTPIGVNLFFNPEEIIRNRSDINILNWKSIPLTFKGSIKVNKLGMWFKIPFDVTLLISDLM